MSDMVRPRVKSSRLKSGASEKKEPSDNPSVAQALRRDAFRVLYRQPYPGMPLHTQPGIELQVTVAGSGVFEVDGRRYAQAPGRGLVLRGEQAHRLEETKGNSLRRHVVCFDPAAMTARMHGIDLIGIDWIPEHGGFAFSLSEQDFAQVDALVKTLRFHTTVQARGWEGMALGALLQILGIVRRRGVTGQSARPSRTELLDEACAHVQANLSERLKLAETAGKLDVSPEHLARTFRRHLGMSFGNYVLAERVTSARDLIAGGKRLSLTDVAFATGFQSLAHFSRVFKTHLGASPSIYRAAGSANPA